MSALVARRDKARLYNCRCFTYVWSGSEKSCGIFNTLLSVDIRDLIMGYRSHSNYAPICDAPLPLYRTSGVMWGV